MNIKAIPVQNVFYLLCYAWEMADMCRKVKLDISKCETMANLLIHVLVKSIESLFQNGLSQDYREDKHITYGIKGKIDFSNTLRNAKFHQGFTVCQFDEYSSDVLINQIIYSTLLDSLRINELSTENKKAVIKALKWFPHIHRIQITDKVFQFIRIHRNNRFYHFIINVCKLFNRSMLPDESKSGSLEFFNIMEDEREMNMIFERFLFNFCKQECSQEYPKIGRSHIRFQLTPLGMTFTSSSIEADNLLPIMETDITLYNPKTGKKCIIDTKFYHKTLESKYGSAGKIRRDHLSQIISYVMNQEDESNQFTKQTCGVLLYPTVDQDIDVSYKYKSTLHIFHVCTINLNQDWKCIEKRLKEIVCR